MYIFLNLTTIIILLFSPPSVQAFFSPPSRDISDHKTASYNQQATRQQLLIGAFIPESTKDNNGAKPVLQPQSYAIADIIGLDLPVYNAMQNPLSPNDSIEHILYANLRLKKILNDYLLIQKKARALLNGKNYTAEQLDTTPDFDRLQQYDHDRLRMSMQDKQLINFTRELGTINKEFHGLVQQVNSKIAHRSRPASTAKGPAVAATGFTVKTVTIPRVNIIRDANSYLRNMLPAPSQSPTASAADYTGEKHEISQSYNREDITLPWIIRMPLNVFHYLMTNVIEAAIYGFLLLIAVSIISASRSSK